MNHRTEYERALGEINRLQINLDSSERAVKFWYGELGELYDWALEARDEIAIGSDWIGDPLAVLSVEADAMFPRLRQLLGKAR